MKKILVLNYEVGNLSSIINSLNSLEIKHIVSDKKTEIKKSDIMILPGVGSFKKTMEIIKKKNLFYPIKNAFKEGKKIVGICVGMQILATYGEEHNKTKGLDIIPGKVIKIPSNKNYFLPIMNWMEISSKKYNDKFKINKKQFYFLHSYYFDLKDNINSLYQYKLNSLMIPAIIEYKNAIGIQFHPEKSSNQGLELLRKILK